MDPSLRNIRDKVADGKRLSDEDALALFRSRDIHSVGEMADFANRRRNGARVYFNVNRHINPTNICVNRCRFCAFGKGREDPLAYTMTLEEIFSRADEARRQNATELHIVGGLHPDLPFDFYLMMLRSLRERFPEMHLQAFTAVEIDYFSRISGLPLREVIRRLKDAGLGSLPGGGAEIFAPEIRDRICPDKISGDRWLEVMEQVHREGLRSNATMLYGHVETLESRVDHLRRLRDLQDRTGGFQSFIPLAFHPKNTEIAKGYTTGIADLLPLAVGRLYLDNFAHVKSFWIMVGPKIAQISLHFGVNDIDGTVVEERITHAAGALTGEEMTVDELVAMIRQAGRIPVERDTLYNVMREWPGGWTG